jgi:hypothetical protein
MQDTTVSSIGCAGDSGGNTQYRFSSRAVHDAAEDDLLARILITSWSLATGRTLRADAAPQSLSEEELIRFWADDQIGVATHARPAGPARAAGSAGPVPAVAGR